MQKSSETSIPDYRSTPRHIPEDCNYEVLNDLSICVTCK